MTKQRGGRGGSNKAKPKQANDAPKQSVAKSQPAPTTPAPVNIDSTLSTAQKPSALDVIKNAMAKQNQPAQQSDKRPSSATTTDKKPETTAKPPQTTTTVTAQEITPKQPEQPAVAPQPSAWLNAVRTKAAPAPTKTPAPVVMPPEPVAPATTQQPVKVILLSKSNKDVSKDVSKDAPKDTPTTVAPPTTTPSTTDTPQEAQTTSDKPKSRGGSSRDVGKRQYKFSEKMHIPQGAAAYIIGKKGANVKRINDTSGAFVRVRENNVSIQSQTKQQLINAKKQVLELLRACMTRTQIQASEFNIFMVEEDTSDMSRLKTAMTQYKGPLSEWLIRDQVLKALKKEIEASTKKAVEPTATTTDDKSTAATTAPVDEDRVYYAASIIVETQEEEPRDTEEDEETEQLNRLVRMKATSTANASTAQKEQKEQDTSSSKTSQGSSLQLVDKQILNTSFSTLADKLVDDKQREEAGRKPAKLANNDDSDEPQPPKQPQQPKPEHINNTVDVEFVLGKKLFYVNQDSKKKSSVSKKQQPQQQDVKMEDVPLSQFLEYKFGFGHKLNTTFNNAVPEADSTKIESFITSKQDVFKLVEKRQVALVNARFNKLRSTATLLITDQVDNGLNKVKVLDYFERNVRLALIDFVRPQTQVLDYRIVSRYYSHVEAPAAFSAMVEKRARFDKTRNAIVLIDVPAPTTTTTTTATKAEPAPKEDKLHLTLDRIKNETIYTDGQYKIIVSVVKDPVKLNAAVKVKKPTPAATSPTTSDKKDDDSQDKKDETPSAATTTAATEDDTKDELEDLEAKTATGEKKIIETVEISIFANCLEYSELSLDREQVTKQLKKSMSWISDFLSQVGL